MTGWNTLFFDPTPIAAVAGKSAEWNCGAYLVEGLGHCGACHTPKNMLGADRNSVRLQGGVIQDWFAPALTDDLRTGLGNWSVDEMVEYLRSGRNAQSAASGPMAEVVVNSTSKLPDAELRAMAVYLKDQPAPQRTPPAPMAAAAPRCRPAPRCYVDNCSACHAANGDGVPRLFPALRGSAVVQSDEPTTLLRVILTGARAAATDVAPTGPAMPAFGWKFTDEQVASLATYVRNAWGNAAGTVSAADVRSARSRLGQRAGN